MKNILFTLALLASTHTFSQVADHVTLIAEICSKTAGENVLPGSVLEKNCIANGMIVLSSFNSPNQKAPQEILPQVFQQVCKHGIFADAGMANRALSCYQATANTLKRFDYSFAVLEAGCNKTQEAYYHPKATALKCYQAGFEEIIRTISQF